MTKYQMLYIIENSLDQEIKDGVIGKISASIAELGGEVVLVEKWGTKKYAYPIDYKTEGYYVLTVFSAPESAPLEIERRMRIDDKIIRQLITKD